MLGIIRAFRERCRVEVPDAVVGVYPAPPVKGLGTAGGFKFFLQDRGSLGPRVMQESVGKFVAAMEDWKLPMVVGDYRADSPQYFLDIDRDKIRTLGIPIASVFQTLQMDVGSFYVNNFNRFGRSWQVKIMADEGFRNGVEDLRQLKVAARDGMVPLATVLDIRPAMGPAIMMRYNLFPAAPITGIPNPFESGSVLIDRVAGTAAAQLPDNFSYEWSEVFFLQIAAGNTAALLLALGIMLVFLVLAALYESWSQPLAVILGGRRPSRREAADRHPRAGGARGARRPGQQERHPDRGVRPPAASRGARRAVGHAHGQPTAAAADPDDVAGLHPRRVSAGGGAGRGGRAPLVAGDHRLRRDDRRDAVRDLPDAGFLLRARPARAARDVSVGCTASPDHRW
jgi:hypothetical protein